MVKAAERRSTQEAKQLALSQTSQEHVVPLAASLEMNRIQHLARECAEIPQLHTLKWNRVADIMPQSYRNNAQGQFPGLRKNRVGSWPYSRAGVKRNRRENQRL